MPDGQQSVLSVRPSSLAGRAQIIVGTNRTLEASSHYGAITAIAGDVGVQGWRRGHMRGRDLRSSGWWRRRRMTKGERREGMKRKVPTVLLLF